MTRRDADTGWRKIFAAPLLLALATVVGLLAALLGDGLWDAVSWAALGVPIVVIGMKAFRGSAT